ncbi:PASTA domain-containing protein [Streptomyces sp. SID8379]|uniref:PASTA domain-containing protein n=1 Tax=unclassified Streptomyces TaxID=2593676 RepID=UPI0003630F6D|nr:MULTISPECIES: PASTA domain-containing protein [unclassified Streptomyces]MYW69755.1 PASTA domain-containing protein [Streptomyces sp. SID8379]
MHLDHSRPARRTAASCALLLALCFLAACQADDDPSPSSATTASPTATATRSRTAAQGTVPDLKGGTVSDARDQLADLDYGMAFTDDSEIGDDSLTVTAQSPAPGTALKPGGTVTLTVPGR